MIDQGRRQATRTRSASISRIRFRPIRSAASRANVIRAFTVSWISRRRTRMFRMNGIDTPFAYRDLVDVVEAAVGDRIDLVMLPKAGSAADVRSWRRY